MCGPGGLELIVASLRRKMSFCGGGMLGIGPVFIGSL